MVELDGGHHAVSAEKDEMRTQEIARRGYRVIRFWNGDVMGNLEGVLQTIGQEIGTSLSAPEGGEGILRIDV